MEAEVDAAAVERMPDQDLVRIADELLEQTRALRRQHAELRDALAGIRVVARGEERLPEPEPEPERPKPESNGHGPAPDLHAMVLQMALTGETRDSTKDQLHGLGVDHADSLVDEVFDRIEGQRSGRGRRRLFQRN